MSFSYFDQTDTGSLINRASSDVLAVKTFVDGVLLKLISVAMTLGVFITYMVQVHATLTLACLATTPMLCLATVSFSRLVQPEYRRSSTLSDQLIQILSESFHGVQVVKGFNAEPSRAAVFLSKSEEIHDQRALIFRITSVFQPVMGFLPQVNQFVLLLFGGYLVVNGDLPLGTGLFVFANLLQDFANQVGQLTNIANTAQTCLAGAERVFEVLDATPECDAPENTAQQPALRGSIRFENVTSGYRDNAVIRDISFEVSPGECIGIMGPTGSGKSTVLNLIPRFYETSSGHIFLDGHDLREIDLRHLRRNVGVVFQEPFLFNNTIAANIAFGCPAASLGDIRRAAKLAAADGFIASLPQGYETMIGENGTNLSGGQRQRIALARTLLLDPRILLVDDTTSAVDSKTEREIHESIFTVLQTRTSIVVSNRLSTLIHMDRILVMHDGQIVEEGSPTTLLRSGHIFRRLVMAQLDDDGHPMTAASWPTKSEETRSGIQSP